MKRLLFSIILTVCAAEALHAYTLKTETITDQGITRTYHLAIPDGLKSGAPLVFVLHGYGGNADGYRPEFRDLADEYGYMVCYPQGSKDSKSKTCWNVGYPWQIGTMTIDDCAFLKNLAAHLQATYDLSAKNTFLTGMSNGGEMCYLATYRIPEVFGAIASIAGLTLIDMVNRYEFKTPVPFMEVHGTGDTTSRWEGDLNNAYGWGAYLPVPFAVNAIVALNKCMFEETTVLPLVKNQVTLHRYYGSKDGNEVLFYEVKNGTHSWAVDSFDTCRAVMDFFKSNIK